MIAEKIKKDTAYQKPKAADVSDLVHYMQNAQEKVAGGQKEEPEKVFCGGSGNFIFDGTEAQIAEMTALASETTGDPIDHWVLSWKEGENPTPEQIEESIKITLQEFGMEDHQYFWNGHQNTKNTHVHLALNRVDPKTRKLEKINNGFDKRPALRACCIIEARQGWMPEANAFYEMTPTGPQEKPGHVRSISPYAAEIERKTGVQSLETRAKTLASEVKAATSWQDLHRRLAAHGATYEKRKGGAVIKFQGQGFVKASKCCREASLSALQKRLGTFERAQGITPRPYTPAPPQVRKDLDLVSLVAAVLLSLFGLHAIATQILYKKQALERYQLRQQKFHSVQARWAAQGVLKQEHKDQRDELKAKQNKEIQAVKKMSHSELLNFSAEKQFIKQEKEEEKMQKIPAFLKQNPDAVPKTPGPEARALAAFEKLHMALKADRYRFTVPHDDKPTLLADATAEEKKAYQKQYAMFSVDKARRSEEELIVGKTGKLVSPGFTVEELRSGGMKDIVKLYSDLSKGMYMTILSENVSYITVDDINNAEKIQKAKEFNFAYAGESSKNNFQGLIKVQQYTENKDIAYEATLRTVVEINKHCGDPLVHNVSQPLRFPTSHNNKPKHKVDGVGFEVKLHKAEDVFCERAQEIYNKHVQNIIQEQQQKQKKTELLKDVIEHKQYTRTVKTEIQLPKGEFSRSGMKYSDLYGTTAAEICVAFDFAKKPKLEGRSLDYEVAIRLRVMGYSQEEVARVISHAYEWQELRNRPESDSAGKTWQSEAGYGEEQARCAFETKNADEKVERLSVKQAEFLRKEKKNAREMQEMYKEQGIAIPENLEIKQEQTRTRGRSR